MRIINLTNEPKIVSLREQGGNILKLYIAAKATKTIIGEYTLTDEALSLKKRRAISIRP